MAAQPQPIYPNELKFELDSLFTRITRYMDGQRDAIMTQMRVDKQELKTEIDQLSQRVTNVEATQKAIIDMQRNMLTTMQTMQQTMQTMQQEMQSMRQEMQDNHAEAMGEIGDVKLRLVKLENKDEDK